MSINERLKYFRTKVLHVTQETFANSIFLSRSNYSGIETGKVTLTNRVIEDICYKYNMNRQWLMEGTGEIFLTKEQPSQAVPSFISDFYSLSEEGQKEISKYITAIIAAKKKEEED